MGATVKVDSRKRLVEERRVEVAPERAQRALTPEHKATAATLRDVVVAPATRAPAKLIRESVSSSLFTAATLKTKDQAAYELRNQRASSNVPLMAPAAKDPRRFFADMTARFEAQKKITPEDPYQFDFSEFGLNQLPSMRNLIEEELDLIEAYQTSLPSPYSKKELAAGQRYLTTLRNEIDKVQSEGKITYRRSIELGQYVARALGAFEVKRLPLGQLVALQSDRLQLGYYGTTIEKEEADFNAGRAPMFPGRSFVYGKTEGQFEDAVWDKNKLNMILVATPAELDMDVMLRLIPHKIFPLGVTRTPILADGYARAGGDFFNHDVRHTQALYLAGQAREVPAQLTDAQMAELTSTMDRWSLELDRAIAAQPDAAQRAALEFVRFNLHHDQGGNPQLPSAWRNPRMIEWGSIMHGPSVTWLSARQRTLAGEDLGFKGEKWRVESAMEFLKKFWAEREPQEAAFWDSVAP